LLRNARRIDVKAIKATGRLIPALALLLVASGVGAVVAPRAGAVIGGYVEVHEVICPPGYDGDSFFEDCHGSRRPDVPMIATGPGDQVFEDSTNAEGVVTFGDFLTPGTVTVAESEPTGDFAAYVVYCSRVDNQQPVPFEYRGNGRAAVAFEMPAHVIAAGTGIVCDWYNIPAAEPAGTSLAIHKSACPAGTTANYFERCHEHGLTGVDFVLDGPERRNGTTAGHLGAVRWDGLPGGTYTIAETRMSGAFADYVVYCSRADTGDAVPFEYRGDGRAAIQLDLPADTLIVCDWYNVPPPSAIEQGTIRVEKTWGVGQEPVEVVEVCFVVTADAGGEDVLGRACTSDETYTVTFGPNEPPLATGVTYYVWEETGEGQIVAGHNPVAVVISAATGQAAVTFENRRVDGAATVELHKRVCPAGGPTVSIFAECHSNPPEQPVAFAVDGGAPQAVDAAGDVVFADLTAGAHQFSETEGPPLDFVDLRVFCSVQGTGEPAIEVTTDGPNFTVAVGTGAYVVCDVYNIPEQLQGITPTATATAKPPAPTPTPVPVEGRPVHLHAGTCDNLAPSPRYPLTDLTTPEAIVERDHTAIVAEVSFTIIPVSLDELLDGAYAINAHASDEEMRIYVACGDVGGPQRADGSVAVGLQEQNTSGYMGIAVLEPDPSAPDQTRVTVYLAPDLAEEARAAGTPTASPAASPHGG
jgi:hypothetical protein